MQLTLLGIDPGIVDTGAVAIRLDFNERLIDVTAKAWTGVTDRLGFSVVTSPQFLKELRDFELQQRANTSALFAGVEGYRPRGKNSRQDEEMTNLVQNIRANLTFGRVVDNTGIKLVVTEPALKLFHVSRFKKGTNHADLKSAARVALMRGLSMPDVNPLLADYYRDNLLGGDESKWQLDSMRIL